MTKRVERRQDQIEGQRLRDDAAAGREHHQFFPRQELIERGLLHAPKTFLAVERDNLGDREAVLRLHFLVQLDEIPADLPGENFSERGFAGAAQSDQRDAGEGSAVRGRAMAGERVLCLGDLRGGRLAQEIADHRPVRCGIGGRDQVFQMRAHRVRHAPQQHDGHIALAAFELRNVALRNTGHLCKHLARHAAQRAHRTYALAELVEKAGFGIVGISHLSAT